MGEAEGVGAVHVSLAEAAARGRDLLLERPLEALRRLVNPSALAEGATLSRSALYKLFQRPVGDGLPEGQREVWRAFAEFQDGKAPPADAAVVASAGLSTDLDWGGAREAVGHVANAWLSGDTPRERLRAGLAANVRHQFRSKGVPLGWIIQSMSMTAAAVWEGAHPTNPDDARLGEALLELRRRHYAQLTAELLPFLGLAIEELRLRPEDGVQQEQILILMHCLMDGAVLRMMIDPDAISVELTAEAMVRLGEAFAMQGSATDPRRPSDDSDHRYDRILSAAESHWRGNDPPALEALVVGTGLSEEEIVAIFPTVADVGDSLLWNLVGDSTALRTAPEDRRLEGEVIFLAAAISRLLTVATTHPAVTRLVFDSDIERGFAYELRIGVANAVRRHSRSLPAEAIADQLIDAARMGNDGAGILTALARAIELDLPAFTTEPRLDP